MAEISRGGVFEEIKIISENFREKHWDKIFQTADYTQVLWHQNSPRKSLELIQKYSKIEDTIIDVGCGTSFLIDKLLESGYKNITLLDISKTSLEIVKKRLDKRANNIHFIQKDVLKFSGSQKHTLWHDRAVFHFLQTQKEQENYFNVLIDNLTRDGVAIIHTFETDGSIMCAGLNVVPYSIHTMKQILPKDLQIVEFQSYLHSTPKGTEQKYIYFVIMKIVINIELI